MQVLLVALMGALIIYVRKQELKQYNDDDADVDASDLEGMRRYL